MIDEKEYSPFELAKQLHEEQLADLEKERIEKNENEENEEIPENFETENEDVEKDFINENEQQNVANRIGQMKGMAKQKAKQMAVQAGKKVAKQAAKKAGQWALRSIIVPIIEGIIAFFVATWEIWLAIAVVLLFALVVMYYKCRIVEWAGIFKPILSLVGIECPIPK
jgi:hypothetical protein